MVSILKSEHDEELNDRRWFLYCKYDEGIKELIARRLRQNNSGGSASSKSELERYLAEDSEDPHKKIDILGWWKENSSRFPIFANMAHDILAIPITTVASESAFSTSGCILDDFRTSLTPFMVQALVCTQDWLRRSTDPIDIKENLEELEVLEKELIEEFGDKVKGKRSQWWRCCFHGQVKQVCKSTNNVTFTSTHS